jgi:hypothetical protein
MNRKYDQGPLPVRYRTSSSETGHICVYVYLLRADRPSYYPLEND